MTETQLFILLKAIIDDALSAASIVAIVKQGDQPNIVGRPSGPVVLLSNQPMRRYGSLKRADAWDATHTVMVHTETQQMECTFQCGALVPQTPATPAVVPGLTAGDLVVAASQALQSDVALSALLVAGLGIYRVTDIRQPAFKDDQDRFEYSPSFDFTVVFANVYTSQTPSTADIAGVPEPV